MGGQRLSHLAKSPRLMSGAPLSFKLTIIKTGLRGAGDGAMGKDEMRSFVRSWISDWNARDLDAILIHYADDAVFHSPMIFRVTGADEPSIKGRSGLELYWRRALELAPDLRFELQSWFYGRGALTILYSNQLGRRVSEAFVFNGEAKVFLSIATYEAA